MARRVRFGVLPRGFGVSEQTIRWSRKSLDELVQFYRQQIEPDLRRAGVDLDGPPSYQTLADHGYSGLSYALREQHDRTVREFLVDDVGLEPQGSDGYEWGIDAEATIDAAESYVSRLDRRESSSEQTVTTQRSKLATYLRTYADQVGDADFMDRLDEPAEQPSEADRVLATMYGLHDRLGTAGSVLSYASVVSEWYSFLVETGRAAYDPTVRMVKDLGVEDPNPDKPALDARQVSAVVDATEGLEGRLLVLAVCAWGLRRQEVAELHVSQLSLEGDDPHVAFDDDRKNGPGTVALLYGVDEVEERLAALGERHRWQGYLFPSDEDRPHVTPDTVTNRFKAIAERADVLLQDDEQTPHAGRRFWYQSYTAVVEELSGIVETVAEEQGSSDPETIIEEYHDEASLRDLRRDRMRERLSEAFEVDP